MELKEIDLTDIEVNFRMMINIGCANMNRRVNIRYVSCLNCESETSGKGGRGDASVVYQFDVFSCFRNYINT